MIHETYTDVTAGHLQGGMEDNCDTGTSSTTLIHSHADEVTDTHTASLTQGGMEDSRDTGAAEYQATQAAANAARAEHSRLQQQHQEQQAAQQAGAASTSGGRGKKGAQAGAKRGRGGRGAGAKRGREEPGTKRGERSQVCGRGCMKGGAKRVRSQVCRHGCAKSTMVGANSGRVHGVGCVSGLKGSRARSQKSGHVWMKGGEGIGFEQDEIKAFYCVKCSVAKREREGPHVGWWVGKGEVLHHKYFRVLVQAVRVSEFALFRFKWESGHTHIHTGVL
eukprot:1160195-Pelagomonas_calceolata.AAC.1